AALRAARRVAPARSMAGAALDAQHGATMRLLAMQIPGQILFSIASQLALILFAGAAAVLTVRGQLGAPEAVALIVVLVFSVAGRSLSDVLTSESVAIEITRSAVGGIALALSVPLTTAIA
ncbi:YibE/F family protein, partial [Mycolicibacterium insubricum]|uniref:YibE/F family protein n=1 Tax=Mycolicibacterium insubricum TaxID=444597 RepID=UPI0021F2ECED